MRICFENAQLCGVIVIAGSKMRRSEMTYCRGEITGREDAVYSNQKKKSV